MLHWSQCCTQDILARPLGHTGLCGIAGVSMKSLRKWVRLNQLGDMINITSPSRRALLQKFSDYICQGQSSWESTTQDLLLSILIMLVRIYWLTCQRVHLQGEDIVKSLFKQHCIAYLTPLFCLLKLLKPWGHTHDNPDPHPRRISQTWINFSEGEEIKLN